MKVTDVLLALRDAEVQIWVEAGQLRLSTPIEQLDANLAARIRECETGLVEFVSRARRSDVQQAPVPELPRDRALPLSFAQQSMWLVLEFGPDGFAHNLTHALRLRGPIDLGALRGGIREIVRRHEALRTTFQFESGNPVQRVRRAEDVDVELLEDELGPVDDVAGEIANRVEAELATPFDVETGLPFRFRLIRIGDRDCVFMATFVHLVFDGASFGVLLRELEELYRAATAGRPPSLPELPIQYADYARWQRRRFEDAGDSLLDYWRGQLDGVAALELPTDRPRPTVTTFEGRSLPFAVPEELGARLRTLATEESCTRFMALLAVFLVQLARWTEQEDLAVGTPVANRGSEDSQHLIGLFLNTLVLRTDVSGNPTFRELLARVRDVVLGAFEHQDMPIEQLVLALRPEREAGRNPLFQVMFNLTIEASVPTFAGAEVEPIPGRFSNSIFDLSLVMGERGGVYEYSPDLFDKSTVEQLARQFVRLIAVVVDDPDRRVWDLPLLGEEEHEELVRGFNATTRPYPRDECIHLAFAAEAERIPDEVAIYGDGGARTFAEVEARANQIANHLTARGARPGQVVGVCLPRSIQVAEVLLGVLKTGAAYLPLDPNYPAERLAYMLEDAAPALLVTEPGAGPELQAGRLAVVDLERDAAAIAACETRAPANIVGGSDAAYVLYTSGSTGRPKGVVGRHRSVINRCHWMWAEYPFEAGEVSCHKTSLSWVDSTWEIFAPLLAGLSLLVLEDDVVRDTPALLRALATHRVSRLVLVPSLLRAMLDSSKSLGSDLPDLRYWLCGGEEMSSELATRFVGAVPHGVLLNMYGFSESSADVAVYDVRDGIPDRGAVPIGHPISNTRVYLLGEHGELVPRGAVGEICVGGDGLAQGYLARPGLTAEKFVPDPFSSSPERLYRSGDLGRWRQDGVLEYLGRNDRQAKVRGHRIELAEIDHVLAQHDAVAACAVVAQRDDRGEARLAGFVVLHPSAMATVTELRTFLRDRLPEHMVPQMLHTQDRLPLQPNGKVDYRALGALVSEQRRGDDASFQPPESEIERKLAVIWQDALEIDRVGRTDAFLDLGGHSLLGIRVIARIEDEFGVRIRLGDLFAQDLSQTATMCERKAARAPERRGVLSRLGFGRRAERQD